jgi:esterase/lipase
MAAAAVTGLAGCNSSNADDTTTDVGERSATSATETPTPTETAEPTATPTQTPVAPDATLTAKTPALIDEKPTLVVKGLEAGQRVTLTATATSAMGGEWRSNATFEVDGDGTVRVAEQAPLEGSYEGADDAGLLWSMRPVQDLSARQAGFRPKGKTYDMTVTATVQGQSVAETTLVRRSRSPEVTTKTVAADDVAGVFATPAVDEPRPGVLALHGSGGDPLTSEAALLASHGYPTLAIEYFGSAEPIPDQLLDVPLSYFDRAADWLRDQPTVRDGDLGVYGWSKGGEGALFLAAYADWVGAVVAGAPSGVAWQGVTSNMQWADGPSWSVDGEPVPYVSGQGYMADTTDDGLYLLSAAYENALSDADEKVIQEATFPVEHCDAPILCLSGEDDGMWPSVRMAEFAVERLREHDAGDRIEHQAYENTGHVIPTPYAPTYGMSKASSMYLGGTPPGIATAAADHWPRVLQTLEAGLK